MESQKGCVPFADQSRVYRSHCILFGRHWHPHLVKMQSVCLSCLLAAQPARGNKMIALVQIKHTSRYISCRKFFEILLDIKELNLPCYIIEHIDLRQNSSRAAALNNDQRVA